MRDPKGHLVTPSDLAAHGAFVRALAASLVRDPSLADDVAQDTWVAALNRGGERASLRSWLAAVARNAARRLFRGESRRARREEIAARAERLPSAAETALRELTLRRVVDAVLALEEPYRSTVLFRYYEDLSVKEIAERANAPLPTVHSRLRRALEQLRVRLDREAGGDRSAWCVTLGGLAGLPRGAPAPGPIPFPIPIAIATIAAAGVAAVIVWGAFDGSSPPPRPDEAAAAATSSDRRAVGGETAVDPTRRAIEAADSAQGDSGTPGGFAAMTASILEGVVVDPSGSPVAGATVWARARFDLLPLGATDADGTFRVPLPEGANSFHARGAGFAPSLAFEVERGDDGTPAPMRLVLPGPGATVIGIVTDASGDPIAGADLRVGGLESRVQVDPFGQAARAPALVATTDADGRFRAEDVEPGRVTVEASAPGFAPSQDSLIATSAGETSIVELRLERGAVLSGIVRNATGAPIVNGHVCVMPPESVARLVRCPTGEDGSYRLDRLEPGHVTFHAADFDGAGHARTMLEIGRGEEATWDPVLGQETADPVAAISGRVVDEGGLPFVDVVVCFTPPHAENVYYSQARTDGNGRFVLNGHSNREGDLNVFEREFREDGNALPIATALGVRAGDADVVISVRDADRPASFIEGRLVGPEDEAIGEALIRVRGDESDRQLAWKPDRETGEFRLGPLRAGRYRLTIATRRFGQRRLDEVEVAHGKTLDLGDVRFDAPGFLATTVRWRESAPRGSLEFTLHRGDPEGWPEIQSVSHFPTPLPLSPGPYKMAVSGSHVRPTEHALEIRSGETTALEIVPVLGTRHRIRFTTEAGAPALGRVRVVVRRFGESTVLYEGAVEFEPGADAVAEIEVDPAFFELEATSDTGLRGSIHGSLGVSSGERVIDVPMRRY